MPVRTRSAQKSKEQTNKNTKEQSIKKAQDQDDRLCSNDMELEGPYQDKVENIKTSLYEKIWMAVSQDVQLFIDRQKETDSLEFTRIINNTPDKKLAITLNNGAKGFLTPSNDKKTTELKVGRDHPIKLNDTLLQGIIIKAYKNNSIDTFAKKLTTAFDKANENADPQQIEQKEHEEFIKLIAQEAYDLKKSDSGFFRAFHSGNDCKMKDELDKIKEPEDIDAWGNKKTPFIIDDSDDSSYISTDSDDYLYQLVDDDTGSTGNEKSNPFAQLLADSGTGNTDNLDKTLNLWKGTLSKMSSDISMGKGYTLSNKHAPSKSEPSRRGGSKSGKTNQGKEKSTEIIKVQNENISKLLNAIKDNETITWMKGEFDSRLAHGNIKKEQPPEEQIKNFVLQKAAAIEHPDTQLDKQTLKENSYKIVKLYKIADQAGEVIKKIQHPASKNTSDEQKLSFIDLVERNYFRGAKEGNKDNINVKAANKVKELFVEKLNDHNNEDLHYKSLKNKKIFSESDTILVKNISKDPGNPEYRIDLAKKHPGSADKPHKLNINGGLQAIEKDIKALWHEQSDSVQAPSLTIGSQLIPSDQVMNSELGNIDVFVLNNNGKATKDTQGKFTLLMSGKSLKALHFDTIQVNGKDYNVMSAMDDNPTMIVAESPMDLKQVVGVFNPMDMAKPLFPYDLSADPSFII